MLYCIKVQLNLNQCHGAVCFASTYTMHVISLVMIFVIARYNLAKAHCEDTDDELPGLNPGMAILIIGLAQVD